MKKKLFITLGSSIVVCLIILLLNYAKTQLYIYFQRTYHSLPLYLFYFMQNIIWALIGRLVLAYFKRPFYNGPFKFNVYAVIAAVSLSIIGTLDWFIGQKNLFLSPAYNIILLLSLFCMFGRAQNKSYTESEQHL